MTHSWLLLGSLVVAIAASACGGDDDPEGQAGAGGTGGSGGSGGSGAGSIEIEGTWSSSFGSTEVIDDDSWGVLGDFPSESEIVEFSNGDNVAITLNPEDAMYSPNEYNRIVWTEPSDDAFYYCTTDFGIDTLDEARALDGEPDASAPDETGCGDFPWTKLTRQ